MENRNAPRTAKRKGPKPLSVIVGTLLIPLSALAAYALVPPSVTEDPSVALASDETIPTSTTVVYDTGVATPQDLAEACGPAGLALVDSENQGTISDLQQAALDALREVCEQQGMALPGKAAPDPIVQTIVVNSGSSSQTVDDSAATTTQPQVSDDSAGQGQYQGEHESEHEHEGESEHEHEGEGGD
jgi:hypothetical protein